MSLYFIFKHIYIVECRKGQLVFFSQELKRVFPYLSSVILLSTFF